MPKRAPRKILIVDDEQDLVLPLALRLTAAGHDVVTAYDGEEGLARAAAFRPDVAVIDLSMPGLDGWQLCRRLREGAKTRRTKVIIMTASLSPELRKRALTEGVTDLLLKPFEEADLLAAVEREFSAGGSAK